MDDLCLTDHREFIEQLVARHVDARVEFVKSKAEIGGKLGRALWGSQTELPLLQFPEHITGEEIEDSLLALAIRGEMTGTSTLTEHADEIDTPLGYLRHLVLHEVAHIKHDWQQNRETDCDLWVYAQMHPET